MKVFEYVRKYEERLIPLGDLHFIQNGSSSSDMTRFMEIVEDEISTAVLELTLDLHQEVLTMLNDAEGKSIPLLADLIHMENDKWNDISEALEAKHGMSPLQQDYFLESTKQQNPKLVPYL